MSKIAPRSSVKLGIVPTHVKFVGGVVPDESGALPRDASGRLVILSSTENVKSLAKSQLQAAQISIFPGTRESDLEELVGGLRDLELEVQLILMVSNGNPMDPVDEDTVVDLLVGSLESAKKFGIKTVGSTSIEQWMAPGATRKEGAEFEAAVDQNVKVHKRVFDEAGLANSEVTSWHIEFLRGVEFQTFTDLGRCWTFVDRVNKAVGRPFFKTLVDAAHCGDSGLSIEQNIELINQIAAGDGLGIFHASAKTTRGCLSTDDGWIGALLAAAARTGKLEYVFAEIFHHEDEALGALRDAVPGHGVDTTDGRNYDQMLAEGMDGVARRLNNLAARGFAAKGNAGSDGA